jgi:hypothetical protein
LQFTPDSITEPLFPPTASRERLPDERPLPGSELQASSVRFGLRIQPIAASRKIRDER